jgi:hypothetical protein
MSRVRAWTFEVLLNHGLELLGCVGLNAELRFKVGAHPTLHLADLPKGKHTLANGMPGLVKVSS